MAGSRLAYGMLPVSTFLAYNPVALAFGTSGLRGLVTDITDIEAYVNVRGALRYLIASGDMQAGGAVVLGGDLRPSTDRIMRAAARAILDAGSRVENSGKIPTPALILHAIATGRTGVMVSGSHIPFDRNGIKINKSVGELLKSDEPGVTREVELVRAEEYARSAAASPFKPDGMLKEPGELPPLERAAEERYVRRYVGGFPVGGLRGITVLVYEHSAVGRDILGRILRELGATVVTAGRAETFIPIDTENITDELLVRLEGLVKDAEAAGHRPNVIVSTDGDSDRPLVAAVHAASGPQRTPRVQFLPGDLLGIIVAEYLRADAVAVPISANDAVERRMVERGVLLEKTRIGSPYVVAALDHLSRRGTLSRIVGWEANGGFLLGSEASVGGEPLAPLPTRDSTLPILANLFAAADQHVTLAALWARLPARFGRAGLLDNVPVAASRAILAGLVPAGSVTEVTLDDATTPDWRTCAVTLGRFFPAALGFDRIVRINVLDGVRVYFANGDVTHIRPSGNAPQLRIYANSDTQERADQIVADGLREPDGILRQLEKAFA